MGSSFLSEVDDTSILRSGLSTRYGGPLGRLKASRLSLPRSGLERSDFVLWPTAEATDNAWYFCFLELSGKFPNFASQLSLMGGPIQVALADADRLLTRWPNSQLPRKVFTLLYRQIQP